VDCMPVFLLEVDTQMDICHVKPELEGLEDVKSGFRGFDCGLQKLYVLKNFIKVDGW